MKKAIIFTMAFLWGANVFSQGIIKGPVMKLTAGTTPSSVDIPADPDIFAANKVQTATITIQFTKAGDPDGFNDPACANCLDWPPDALNAMEHAAFFGQTLLLQMLIY